MAATPWMFLCVEDDAELGEQVKEFLSGEVVDDDGSMPIVEVELDFEQALAQLDAHRFDLVILDIRLGTGASSDEDAGIRTFEEIRGRRFVPIVFYTAIPGAVSDLVSPLVRVVEKSAGLDALLAAVRGIFATRLPEVNRALIRHVEGIQRTYMWEFVAEHWERFGETPDRVSLAFLLARRLALSLSGEGIATLAADLGDPRAEEGEQGRVPAMRYYVLPPVEPSPLSGDLYRGAVEGTEGFWALLTPSCDLVQERPKAQWVLLAGCLPLEGQEEYTYWREHDSNTSKTRLERLMGNNREQGQADRFHFLPGALTLPDLIVDFQLLATLSYEDLGTLERVSSLDSPFAEALIARFTRYWSRVGTPDLDLGAVLTRLRSGTASSEAPPGETSPSP